MASIDIIELKKTETGEIFYPLTHADAVIGLNNAQFFERYDLGNGHAAVRLKQEYDGLFSDGFLSAGGLNTSSGGGGGGGATSLSELSDVLLSSPTNGQALVYDSTAGKWKNATVPGGGGGGGGSVTSVGLSAGTGLAVTTTGNNPITSSGTFTISIASGYKLPLQTEWDGKISNVQADWNATSGLARILNKPALAAVATSGSYNDLLNKPIIPAAQIQSDWSQTNTSALDFIKNKPTIPTVNNATLTVRMNGSSIGTFSANASSNKTIDLGTVITSLSGYVTDGNMEAYVDSVLSDFAPDSAVVHNTGNEDIGGNKTFMERAYFDDGFNVAEWSDIYCEGEDETLEDAFGYCVHTTGNETVNGVKTFTDVKGILMPNKRNKGSMNQPIYIDATGELSQASLYAGGTKVYLNGTNKGASTIYIYAPSGTSTSDAAAYGTSGQYLVSQGRGAAPVWTDHVLDIRSKSFLGSDANLNSIYDPSFGDLYGRLRYYAYVSHVSGKAGINGFPTSSNANALLTIDTYSDTESLYLYQMGFSANGSIYYRNGNAVKVDGNWVAPWNNGNWNRLLFEDHNGDATTTRDLTAGRNLVVARGNMVKFDAEGTSYMKLGSPGDNSFYINAGNNGTNPVFYETSALCPNSDTASIGVHWKFWNNIYVKRWYPNPNDDDHYIEYVSGNPGYFRVHGNIVADGQVAAGGIISNS